MKKVLGIVNLHHNISLGGLTSKRSIASVTLLGRYTFIDFAISSYTNSGINDITVLIKDNSRSLLHHFGFGQLNYNLNLKTGGLSFLMNERYINNPIYNTDINNMLENIRYIENSNVKDIIIAPVHMLNSLDFRPYIEKHQENDHEITVIYKESNEARKEFLNSFYVDVKNDRVQNIAINKGLKDKQKIFMEITIIKKSRLLEILKTANSISMLYSFRDFIIYNLENVVVHAMEYQGYLKCFDCLDHYAQFSLELLNTDIRNQLFTQTIYTRSYDTPPTKYTKNAEVTNSFIANGTIIKGRVDNSIIGRGVVIEEGAVVKDSIIFANSYIAQNSEIEKTIVDKNVKVRLTKQIKGKGSYIVIPQGENI